VKGKQVENSVHQLQSQYRLMITELYLWFSRTVKVLTDLGSLTYDHTRQNWRKGTSDSLRRNKNPLLVPLEESFVWIVCWNQNVSLIPSSDLEKLWSAFNLKGKKEWKGFYVCYPMTLQTSFNLVFSLSLGEACQGLSVHQVLIPHIILDQSPIIQGFRRE